MASESTQLLGQSRKEDKNDFPYFRLIDMISQMFSLSKTSLKQRRIKIERDIFSQEEIDDAQFSPEPELLSSQIKDYFYGLGRNLFPPLEWVPKYKKQYVIGDVISGLTVAMIRLPQVFPLHLFAEG